MSIDSNMEIPGSFIKRVGRPHQPWIVANCKWIFDKEHTGVEYKHDNVEQKSWVQTFCNAGFWKVMRFQLRGHDSEAL